MSVLEKVIARGLLEFSRRQWGMSAVLMPVIVETLGPFGTIRWFARNIPTYERCLRDMGPMRAHLLFAAASLMNGCSYCTYAHGRAFELHYFEKYGKLFPLDDHQLISLIPLTDDTMQARLNEALEGAGLREEIDLVKRLYDVKLGGAQPGPADRYIVHAIQMYDTLNFCAIDSQANLDEAHDRINRNSALKERYAAARLAIGRTSLTVDDIKAVEDQRHAGDPEPSG